MTQKQKQMLENVAKINRFSFNDNLKVGDAIIKINEIEQYDIPYQNEIINKIMKKEYSIDLSEKIEKLKQQQLEKAKENKILLLIEKIKNYDFFYKYGLEQNKPTWLKYLNKAKKELEQILGENK